MCMVTIISPNCSDLRNEEAQEPEIGDLGSGAIGGKLGINWARDRHPDITGN